MYKSREYNAIGRRRWNITTQERLWCGNGNHLVSRKRKCEVDVPFISRVVNLGKWSSLWCPWFKDQQDTSVLDNFWIPNCFATKHHRYTCKWDQNANYFCPVESKDCMSSASHEYRKVSERKAAQFVPIGMPTACWKTFPAKTTKILSTRNSSILMMSSSELLFLESECSFTKYVSSTSYPSTKYLYLLMSLLFNIWWYMVV